MMVINSKKGKNSNDGNKFQKKGKIAMMVINSKNDNYGKYCHLCFHTKFKHQMDRTCRNPFLVDKKKIEIWCPVFTCNKSPEKQI